MTDLKVVEFKPKKTEEPEEDPARLPNAEELEMLLMGQKMKACFVLVKNEDGIVSHYHDHFQLADLLGSIEICKSALLNPMLEEEL